MNHSSALNKMFPYVLTFLGGLLLLLGNTLPWPCSPGSWYSILCDPSLDVFDAHGFGTGVFIVIMTLVLILEVNLTEGNMSYIAWASYWIILYFLFVAKIRPDSLYPSFHHTWVRINMSVLTIGVTPLSLFSYWLALRPKDIRKKLRKITIISLSALLLSTSFFLVFAMIALDLQLRFAFQVASALKSAPVTILAGGLLLIGAEYLEMRSDREKSVKDERDEQEDIEPVEDGEI